MVLQFISTSVIMALLLVLTPVGADRDDKIKQWHGTAVVATNAHGRLQRLAHVELENATKDEDAASEGSTEAQAQEAEHVENNTQLVIPPNKAALVDETQGQEDFLSSFLDQYAAGQDAANRLVEASKTLVGDAASIKDVPRSSAMDATNVTTALMELFASDSTVQAAPGPGLETVYGLWLSNYKVLGKTFKIAYNVGKCDDSNIPLNGKINVQVDALKNSRDFTLAYDRVSDTWTGNPTEKKDEKMSIPAEKKDEKTSMVLKLSSPQRISVTMTHGSKPYKMEACKVDAEPAPKPIPGTKLIKSWYNASVTTCPGEACLETCWNYWAEVGKPDEGRCERIRNSTDCREQIVEKTIMNLPNLVSNVPTIATRDHRAGVRAPKGYSNSGCMIVKMKKKTYRMFWVEGGDNRPNNVCGYYAK